MHTYLSSHKVEKISEGLRIEFQTPMGDFIFDAHQVLMQSLIDKLIDTLYCNTLKEIEDKIEEEQQLSLFEGGIYG